MNGKEVTNTANGGKPLHALMSQLVQESVKIAETVTQDYKDLVLRYVRKMRLFPYPDYDFNNYPFVCRIVIDEILIYAQENPEKLVRMFVGDVKSEFYGDHWLLGRISELAKEGVNFNIILAKPPTGQYLAGWQKLMTESPGNVTVRMKPQYSDKLCNLILVGDSAYRFEAPHPYYEGEVTELSPERPARFAFHDKFYAETEVLKHWNSAVNISDVGPLPIAV